MTKILKRWFLQMAIFAPALAIIEYFHLPSWVLVMVGVYNLAGYAEAVIREMW